MFLNYEQDLLYTFDLRGVSRMRNDFFLEMDKVSNWHLGDLYAYEISAIDEKLLQLGFVFASGAEIVAQFTRLIFSRRRIKRKYAAGEM